MQQDVDLVGFRRRDKLNGVRPAARHKVHLVLLRQEVLLLLSVSAESGLLLHVDDRGDGVDDDDKDGDARSIQAAVQQ